MFNFSVAFLCSDVNIATGKVFVLSHVYHVLIVTMNRFELVCVNALRLHVRNCQYFIFLTS